MLVMSDTFCKYAAANKMNRRAQTSTVYSSHSWTFKFNVSTFSDHPL